MRSYRLFAAFLAALAFIIVAASPAEAQQSGLLFPAPAGTHWGVLAGYNTATHEGVDPYAIDFWRLDADTGGTPLLSPVTGTVGYTSDSCLSVLTQELDILLCHVFMDQSLERGDPVAAGQRIGTVAPAGQAENNGVAHIHFQVNARDDAPGSTGEPIALDGAYALDGVSFPATTEYNAHFGEEVTSTNGESDAAERLTVDAGPDQTVAPGEDVSIVAVSANSTAIAWEQTEGPEVDFDPSGAVLTFTAPDEAGVLTFRVHAAGAVGVATDRVTVTVGEYGAEAEEPAPASTLPVALVEPGEIVSGEVYQGGLSMIVWGGGSTDALVDAIDCTLPERSIWTIQDSRFVGYRPDVQVAALNAGWRALFPGEIPPGTGLVVSCSPSRS